MIQAEGVRTYKRFISSLLDITDTLKGDIVVPPENVVRRDSDDPYLVVAADKGTATFSDTANEFRLRTASGSMMPSLRADRRAMTTRRWASPRAAPGRP